MKKINFDPVFKFTELTQFLFGERNILKICQKWSSELKIAIALANFKDIKFCFLGEHPHFDSRKGIYNKNMGYR